LKHPRASGLVSPITLTLEIRIDMKDALGNRIKRYEAARNYRLTPRSPVFLRVDGKAFHTYTRGTLHLI